MPSLSLDYDPFVDAASLKRLLKDLALAVLGGKLYPRQVSTARALVNTWVRVDEHVKVEDLERRIEAIEKEKEAKQV